MKTDYSKKIALRGLLIALAFVLSWVEMQIPYFFPIPGIKLGLTNLVVLIALYRLSAFDAFALNMVRILLVSFTFGNMAALIYSAAGGMLSFIAMFVLKKYTNFSLRFVSVAGGIFHNMGQILVAMGNETLQLSENLVAMLVLKSIHVLWYLPFLWIGGILAGIVIGLLGEFTVKRIRFK